MIHHNLRRHSGIVILAEYLHRNRVFAVTEGFVYSTGKSKRLGIFILQQIN